MDQKLEHARRLFLDRPRVAKYALAFVICSSLFTAYQMVRRPRFQFECEISGSAPPGLRVKLSYDLGHGFNDADSCVAEIRSESLTSFKKFRCELPRRKDIAGLHLDSLTTAGFVTMRNVAIVGRHGVVAHLPISDVVSLANTGSRKEDPSGKQVTFTALTGTVHPQLAIRLTRPVTYKSLLARDRRGSILIGNAIWLGFFIFLFSRPDLTSRWRSIAERQLQLVRIRVAPKVQLLLRLGACFVICSVAAICWRQAQGSRVQLTLEMSSSVSSAAQLFYDIGNGYSEQNSRVLDIHAGSDFTKLAFDLPNRNILRFRFDPLTTAGSITLRRVSIEDPDGLLIQIPISDIKAYNQIQTRVDKGEAVSFATLPGANDPGLTIDLHRDVDPAALSAAGTRRAIGRDIAVLLLVTVAVLLTSSRLRLIWQELRARIEAANRPIVGVARRLSNPDFIVFDSAAIWFYLLCIVIALVAVLADLNGSSVGMYSSTFGAPEKALAGAPRVIRADEWAYETPAILNQSFRRQRFAAEHSFLGDHWVALGANVPVWHISTLFRPQFWAFFLLPSDYAYSAYWQFKSLILVTGLFSLLLLLTRSTLWSIAGSLWYFFSPCTQWTYSWPSALPEMVGSMCMLVVLSCFLTIGTDTTALAVATISAASAATIFGLCAYLPHQIPVFWFGVFLIAAWCIAKRQLIFRREASVKRACAVGAALLMVLAVGVVVFSELRVAIVATAGTAYPGARDFSGGETPFQLVTSQLMPWTQTEGHFPPLFLNVCESSGFLWLAPVTLFSLHKSMPTKFQKAALIALWCSFTVILLWLLTPVPAHVGRILGFNQTKGTRLIPALGIANICIVAMYMSIGQRRRTASNGSSRMSILAPAAGVFLTVYTILLLTNQTLALFFTWMEVLYSSVFLTLTTMLLLEQRKIALAIAIVVPQAALFATVNPIERGIEVFTASPLYKLVHSHEELLDGKWLVYSDSHATSGYLAAIGCDVYTGSRYLPDIDHFSDLVAAGLSLKDFDRDGMLLARPLPRGAKTSSSVPAGYAVLWNVSPSDPILVKLHIDYFAFDREPSVAIANQLSPLTTEPVSHLWIYKRSAKGAADISSVIK